MPINMEAAQLVVGAAILDARFRSTLLKDRTRALQQVEQQAGAPPHVLMTAQDRQTLGAIPARTLAEFALGVERLRVVVASPTSQPSLPLADMAEVIAS